MLDHALGFAAIDDGVGFPRIVRLAFEERDGPADQAFTAGAERFQRFLLPLIDALDLVGVSGDGRVLVFSEAVHLVVVQSTHVVRLPAMLLLLLRFLTLLALGDCGLRAPPYIRGERASLVLLCGGIGLVPVFRLAAELSSGTLLFDGFLAILCAPLGFFSEGLLPVFRALAFFTSAAFGDRAVVPPSLTRPFSACRPSSAQSCGAPHEGRVPLRVRVAELAFLLVPRVSPLIVIGHVALLRLVATLPPAPADTCGAELAQACWTYLDHRVAGRGTVWPCASNSPAIILNSA